MLSITGGAADFEIPLGLRQEIKVGISKTALDKNAFIVTGGTNSGGYWYIV